MLMYNVVGRFCNGAGRHKKTSEERFFRGLLIDEQPKLVVGVSDG